MNTWVQCPRKFKFKYIDKIKVKDDQTALNKGKLVHCMLEHNGDKEKIQGSRDFKQSKNHMTPDEIKGCIKVYQNFKESSISKWLDTTESMFNELSIAMDKDLNTVKYDSEDALFRGFIDKVSHKNDVLILCDYKTGRYNNNQNYDQLLYYGISLFSLMPFDKIMMMFVYVEHNKYNMKVLHRKDIKKYQKALLTNIKNIEEDQEFCKNETALCDWCSYRSLCLG